MRVRNKHILQDQNLILIYLYFVSLMASEIVSGSPVFKKTRKKRNRYSRISLKAKLIFFRKVIHEKGNLRDIAKRLSIKYSTAKTLTRNYKAIPQELNVELVNKLCEQFQRKERGRKRCSYRMIEEQSSTSQNVLKAQCHYRQGWFTHNPIQVICNSIAQE